MLTRWLEPHKRDFSSLSEREVLALAVAAEEEDSRIYAAYAERLGPTYPGSAKLFAGMA
jgi:rubrerythrin